MEKNAYLKTILAENQTSLWYLGQEGFVVGSQGFHLAVDPYLSDYVDKNCCQFVQWMRLYQPPVQPSELDFLDVVLCTHSHYDHMDPWTLPWIAKANPKTVFVVPAPEVETLAGYGIEKSRILPAYAQEELTFGTWKVTPIPSAHESFHTDADGNYHELGYIIDTGFSRIFHAGDMCMYDGLANHLENIDIAILPINGRDYFRNANDIIGNFDSAEAVTLAKMVHADLLIPVHHDLYQVNKVNPAFFVDTLMNINPMQKYHLFVPGERMLYAR